MPQVTHSDELVTKTDLASFYQGILPYLGGNAEAGFTPVGTVISVMGNSAPTHYLACDGTTYNIADYPELSDYFYQQFGTKNYFGGDGTITFAVPDLRGEFLRGSGTNSHTDQGDGANVGVHQDGTEIPVFWASDTNKFAIRQSKSSTVNGIRNIDGTKNASTTRNLNTEALGGASTSSTNYADIVRPTNTSVLYCIATKNIFMNLSLDYFTSEKVVGTWINGKPLYQKTVEIGALPNNTTKNVAHNISNLGFVIEFTGTAYNPTSGLYDHLNRPGISSSANGNSCVINATNISITTGSNMSEFTQCYMTVQYTKTTD